MDLGPNATFIWLAYAVVTVTILGLIMWLIADGHRQRADLDALERDGVRRRSSRGQA